MTPEQHMLVKLAEECDEVSQRALKQVQFGPDEVQNGQELTNKERLTGEVKDLLAILTMLAEMGQVEYLSPVDMIDHTIMKRAKIAKYYNLSKSLGMVE